MKAFWVQMINLDLSFDISRDVEPICKKMANSTLSSLWHSEMEWDNAVYNVYA